MCHGYLERINDAKVTISTYGTNPILTRNSLDGLKKLEDDFIRELSKETQNYKGGE